MKKTILLLTVLACMTQVAVAATSCESLSGLALKNATITMATSIAAGAFPPPPPRGGRAPAVNPYAKLPAFCRVTATLTPVPDSEIKIEVWLPAGWNGKLEALGNGAWAGSISTTDLATAIGLGYAAVESDTGHTGGNPATFVIGHPEKVIDFAYRAVHEMTVAAKSLVGAYYGNGPKLSYFNGCSTGGRQALTEVQRYPNDFDGVIAGAAAINGSKLHGNQVWTGQMSRKDPAGFIPATKYPALHAAALKACDELDGVKDGVIENPKVCKFDPRVLLCTGEDNASCLTAAQVEVARKTYGGAKNSITGKRMFPGLEPGSESGWSALSGTQPMALSQEVFRYLVHKDANWDYALFNADTDIPLAQKTMGSMFDAADPNLKPFFDHGGKLLMYHGWADPGISPRNSVNYYESVVDKMGKKKTSNSIRLFMVPGMGHCAGGDGTDTFDKIGTLDQWVEQGKAPDSILASHAKSGVVGAAGVVDKTRPLCAYPKTALYKGSGSTDDASNFVCK